MYCVRWYVCEGARISLTKGDLRLTADLLLLGRIEVTLLPMYTVRNWNNVACGCNVLYISQYRPPHFCAKLLPSGWWKSTKRYEMWWCGTIYNITPFILYTTQFWEYFKKLSISQRVRIVDLYMTRVWVVKRERLKFNYIYVPLNPARQRPTSDSRKHFHLLETRVIY